MRERIKQRLLDLSTLIVGIVIVLGALHVYNRLEAHNRLVEEIITVLQQSQPRQPPAEVPENVER